MNRENGSRIHARDIKPGMRVKNIIRQPWETESVIEVASIETVDIDGHQIWRLNGTGGGGHVNMTGWYALADVPAEHTVTEVTNLPVGTYVTVLVRDQGRGARLISRRTVRDAFGEHHRIPASTLVVVGEHYDSTARLMLAHGPRRAA